MTGDISTDQNLLADSGSPSSDDYLPSDQFTDGQLISYQTGRESDINDSEQPTDLNNALVFNEEQLTKPRATDEVTKPLGMRRRRQMLT